MSGPDDYYDEGEAEMYPEQCTGCDQYIDSDTSDGFCAECREARSEEDPEDEDKDEFADTQIMLSCPQCHGAVGYDEVLVDPDNEGGAMCPLCGGSNPTDDWFA